METTSFVVYIFAVLSAPESGYPRRSFNTSTITFSILIPIAFVVLFTCVCAVIRRKHQYANTARTEIAYQTTPGTVDVQAGI